MIEDPNPADSSAVDIHHPAKLAAAEQMCFHPTSGEPQLYNHDKCGSSSGIPDSRDPNSEVRPKGLKQQEDLEIANNTVSKAIPLGILTLVSMSAYSVGYF